MHGLHFKINTPTVALEPGTSGDIVQIPAGSAVKVLGHEPGGDQLLKVDWNGRTVSMYARDLLERGEPISDSNR